MTYPTQFSILLSRHWFYSDTVGRDLSELLVSCDGYQNWPVLLDIKRKPVNSADTKILSLQLTNHSKESIIKMTCVCHVQYLFSLYKDEKNYKKTPSWRRKPRWTNSFQFFLSLSIWVLSFVSSRWKLNQVFMVKFMVIFVREEITVSSGRISEKFEEKLSWH